MGRLRYGTPEHECGFDDCTLAHLAVAFWEMLHKNESFSFSFMTGAGPTTLWISRNMPLRFDFDSSAPVWIRPSWVTALEAAAHTPEGLCVANQPVPARAPELSAAV